MIKKRNILLLLGLMFYMMSSAQSRIYNFNAFPLKDSVRLSFTVTQGSSCAGWVVENSTDSVNFYQIYNYGGLCGNITAPEIYSYLDYAPNKLTPNFYRIHIPPSDYSVVRRVDMAASFTNLLIFPQPVEDILSIAISGQKNYYYEINIYDRFGRKKGFGSGNAAEKITLDVSSFAEGVYVFYIVTNTAGNYRGKFLKKPKGN